MREDWEGICFITGKGRVLEFLWRLAWENKRNTRYKKSNNNQSKKRQKRGAGNQKWEGIHFIKLDQNCGRYYMMLKWWKNRKKIFIIEKNSQKNNRQLKKKTLFNLLGSTQDRREEQTYKTYNEGNTTRAKLYKIS